MSFSNACLMMLYSTITRGKKKCGFLALQDYDVTVLTFIAKDDTMDCLL